MGRRPGAGLATIVAVLVCPLLAEAANDRPAPPLPRSQREFRFFRRPVIRPPIFRFRPPPPLLIEPPDRFLPPPVGGPSPLERDQIPGPSAPFSHGFHLTVPIGTTAHHAPATLGRFVEVGQALGACWTPPDDLSWSMITLRLSFRRDGSVNGEPRIPYTQAGSAQQKSDLARSLLGALKRCTPLPFSPSLGSAIAGEIFAISFTHQDRQ